MGRARKPSIFSHLYSTQNGGVEGIPTSLLKESFPPLPHVLSYPDLETLSHPQSPPNQDPTLVSSQNTWNKNVNYWGRTDARDLAALLAYGPPHIPYTYGWTDNRVEQVRHFKQWQYVAIDCIANRIASQMPNISWVTSDREGDGLELSPGNTPQGHAYRLKSLRTIDRRKALTPLLTNERLEPVPANHPLLRLLRDPNNQDTSWDLWYETMLFLLLTGSAYWWLPPGPIPSAIPGQHLPAAIWVIPSHWMWPIVGKEKIIEAWEIRPVEGNYLRRRLPAEEIIHFRRKNPISKLDGFSPLTAVNQWVDSQESISGSMMRSYRNGPLPNVAISFDGTMNDPTDEELRRIEAKFLTRYGGDYNAGKPIFTPPGVKITPLTIEPNKQVFGPTLREMAHAILCGYRIPPGYVFLEGDTLRDEAAFLSTCINPWCRFLGWTVTERVARQYPKKQGGEVRVWWERMFPDDPHQLNEDIKTDLLAGATTPSEIRAVRGKEPYTGKWEEFGNSPFLPVNMQTQMGSNAFGGEHEAGDNNENTLPSAQLNDEDSKSGVEYTRLENGSYQVVE